MLKMQIRTSSSSYPVFLGRGILTKIGMLMSRSLPAGPVLVISDRQVAPRYAPKCLQSLRSCGFKPSLKILAGGEEEKSLAVAAKLYTRALQAGLDRRAAIVALGGGVIGDLAGFVAATFLRGIPFVQVPTTLLAMVDSSIGGKVAVNHPRGKNLIGAFYQPNFVLGDVAALQTLPAREFNAGLAELVKYAFIGDKVFFERLESLHLARFSTGDNLQQVALSRLFKPISQAIRIKGEIVSRDEREKDLRRLLNFGHTFAHALESVTGYAYYRHGEAVACGMLMAIRLAALLQVLDRASARRMCSLLLRQLNFISPPPGLNPHAVARALFYDKKKEGTELVFILPCSIGKVLICKAPPFHLIQKVINEYLQGHLQKTR